MKLLFINLLDLSKTSIMKNPVGSYVMHIKC